MSSHHITPARGSISQISEEEDTSPDPQNVFDPSAIIL